MMKLYVRNVWVIKFLSIWIDLILSLWSETHSSVKKFKHFQSWECRIKSFFKNFINWYKSLFCYVMYTTNDRKREKFIKEEENTFSSSLNFSLSYLSWITILSFTDSYVLFFFSLSIVCVGGVNRNSLRGMFVDHFFCHRVHTVSLRRFALKNRSSPICTVTNPSC